MNKEDNHKKFRSAEKLHCLQPVCEVCHAGKIHVCQVLIKSFHYLRFIFFFFYESNFIHLVSHDRPLSVWQWLSPLLWDSSVSIWYTSTLKHFGLNIIMSAFAYLTTKSIIYHKESLKFHTHWWNMLEDRIGKLQQTSNKLCLRWNIHAFSFLFLSHENDINSQQK